MIYIEQWISDEVKIETLPSPFHKIDCPNKGWAVMASNNRFLLLDQDQDICLFDRELALVKQLLWEYDRIRDMCWSSTLNSFIMVTDKGGAFLINEDMTLVEPIKTTGKEKWLSCTCSDANLFITTNKGGSDIFEFHLLSSFNLIKQWKPPESCDNEEIINSIAYNNGTLVALIEGGNRSKTLKIELASSLTLDRLWSLPPNLTNCERVYRVCLLRCDEWLLIDHQTTRLFHIGKDGKLKFTKKYDSTPQNAVLFGSNILAIRTTNCINFHGV